jgi:hypothetical protein
MPLVSGRAFAAKRSPNLPAAGVPQPATGVPQKVTLKFPPPGLTLKSKSGPSSVRW